ncbi:MAG: copper-translocating P-type ATPase [Geobacteraceae bacterium GWC2_58_44]|nr:MAG: copper-translocating P-type ATPase [Geobacteraceae bacterium GWC2_58_44]
MIIGKQEQGDHSWNLLRLGFGALLAMNIMMISLLLYSGSVETETIPLFRLILLGLALPALAVLIPPFLAGAVRELGERRLSLDALITGGSLSAFAVSAVNAVRGSGEVYFDTATMLPVLVTLGKIIEASAKTRAADLLHTLESLLPETAMRVISSGVDEVGIGLLRPGDLVRVRPGERIAVDGCILEGASSIEEAAFSGEFLPRLCTPGDRVIAGTVNGSGTLLVQADRTGKELLLHGIIDLIHDAWSKPSRAERIAERAAALFIPAVLIIAAGSMVWWSMLGDAGQGLLSALSVLVVACPCTMGIATPLATSLAISRAARAGIVVRGGSVMERMAKTETVFFDKTGTITTGCPIVQEIVPIDPLLDKYELLGRLAALESASEHALGKAVIAMARGCGADSGSVSQVQVCPGRGISGAVTWRGVAKQVTAGTAIFVSGAAGSPAMDGSSTMVDVAWDGELRGRLLFTDTIRPDAGPCVAELRRRGMACVLLSGDRFAAASAIADRVGMEEVSAPRSPVQKVEAISAVMAAGRTVAMIGDGINDAPALAAAHTGIALGAGTELAKQSGDVVILSGQLMQIPWLISLSKETRKIIRGNFAWSFGYNAVALAAAAAALLHPLLAALAMVVSSLTVLGNSLRITAFPGCQPPDEISRPGAGTEPDSIASR